MDFLARKILIFYETCEEEKVESDIVGVITMNSYFSNMKTVMLLVKHFWLNPIENTSTEITSFSPACTTKNFEVIEKLAERYQDFNSNVENYNKNGFHMITEMATAFHHENKETFKYLIDELKLEPKVEGYDGRDTLLTDLNITIDPLLYLSEYLGHNCFLLACSRGEYEIVVYLSEIFPELINSVDVYNNSGLHLASYNGHFGTVIFLIDELNFDPAVGGSFGSNSFLHACMSGSTDIVKYLSTQFPKLVNSSVNNDPDDYTNGLHLASLLGNLETVIFLIEELDFDPVVKEQIYGCNSFLFACMGKITERMEGNSEIVRYFSIRFPELMNTVDNDNNTGLHLASNSGNLEIVKFMIDELYFDPTFKSNAGYNSFLCACHSC